jgi:large subunit ribosomal protein L32
MRRSHHHLTPLQIQYCSNCEQPVLPHRVCANCGWYQGRLIAEPKTKKK